MPITFSDVLVSSVQTGGSSGIGKSSPKIAKASPKIADEAPAADSVPMEDFSLNFEEIKSAPFVADSFSFGVEREIKDAAPDNGDQEPEHGADSFVFNGEDDPEAILIGLLLPAVQKVREAAARDGDQEPELGADGVGGGPRAPLDQEPELGFETKEDPEGIIAILIGLNADGVEPEEEDLPGATAGRGEEIEVLSWSWGETHDAML